jgi:hypothetical protein
MSLSMRLYVGAVIAAGALALGASLPLDVERPLLAMTFLAAMLVVSLFKLRLPLGRGQSTLSMAYVIDFAVLVTSGVEEAAVIAAAGVLVQCLVKARSRQPWYRTAFSVAAVVLAVQSAGWTWSVLGGTIGQPGFATTILPLALAAIPYFAVNTGLVAMAIALSNGLSPARYWGAAFGRIAPGYLLAAAMIAATQLLVAREVYLTLPAAALPMFACHVAYAYWFRQQRDARPVASPALT